MQKPEAMQFMPLIITGTSAGVGAKIEAKRARSMKRGAPGGCPTSSLYDVAMNSLQSHRLVVGSMVMRYVADAMAKTSQPMMLFHCLNVCIFYCFSF